MKDETFDELLKRRIESHDMPFSSSEVERAHQHVQRNLPSSKPVKSFSKLAVNYVVGGFLTVGSVLGVFQYLQNKKLSHKLEQIETQLKKYESKLQRQQSFNTESENASMANLAQIAKTKQPVLNASSANTEFRGDSYFKTVNVPRNLQKPQKDSKEIFAVNATRNAETPNLINSISEEKVDLQDVEQTSVIQVDTVSKAVVIAPVQLVNLAKPTKDTAAIADSIKEVKRMLPKINYGFGITGNMGMEERGLGLVLSVVKNQRWQFQSGIRLSQYQDKIYEDEEDFWRSEKTNFATEYGLVRPGIHIKDVQNIQFKYSAVHIPISISYLLPLKNDFSFVLGLGTDFSLRTQENIMYRARVEPGNITVNHEMNLIRTSVFGLDNAVFSMGVQKQWKGFAFQSMMYMDKKIGNMNYRQLPMSAGLKLQILYYLRK